MKYDVAIIGAGFAGLQAAKNLCLTEPNLNILVIDEGEDILGKQGTSFNQCGKIHLGHHYAGHIETAKECLRNSVHTILNSGKNLIINNEDNTSPNRRGRHYVVSNSQYTKEEIISLSEELRKEYKEISESYPEIIEILGKPENFNIYLPIEKFEKNIAKNIKFQKNNEDNIPIKVVLGIETPESQIDVIECKKYFNNLFLEHKNHVEIKLKNKVLSLQHDHRSLSYFIEVKNNLSEYNKIEATNILNCTWQNIEVLDWSLGFPPKEDIINRLKIHIRVKLPKKLENEPTCIFSIGNHMSFTNITKKGEKPEAIITYERITNIGYFSGGTSLHRIEDKIIQAFLLGKVDIKSKIGKELAQEILNGACNYIPDLKDSEITYIGSGVVKICNDNQKKFDLYSRDSIHHQRPNENCAKSRDIGYITLEARKMTYANRDSKKATKLINDHEMVRNIVKEVRDKILDLISKDKEAGKNHITDSIIKNINNDVMNLLKINIENESSFKDLRNNFNLLIDHYKINEISSYYIKVIKIKNEINKVLASKKERNYNFFPFENFGKKEIQNNKMLSLH